MNYSEGRWLHNLSGNDILTGLLIEEDNYYVRMSYVKIKLSWREKIALSTLWNLFDLSLKSEHMKIFVWYILKNKNKTQSTHKGYELSILLFLQTFNHWICILLRQMHGRRLQILEWRLSQFTECEQKRTVIIFISQSYTEKIFFIEAEHSIL